MFCVQINLFSLHNFALIAISVQFLVLFLVFLVKLEKNSPKILFNAKYTHTHMYVRQETTAKGCLDNLAIEMSSQEGKPFSGNQSY